jgi:N-acetylmuramoyl-L-alanine amidase
MSITQKSTTNYTAGRGGNTIKKIVVHHMVGTIEGADKTFQDTVRQTSAHYGVGRDGRIWQWVAESSTAWHAGNFAVNQQSVGIEHEDLAHDDFTDTLYKTSAELIADICKRHNLPINASTIVPHRSIVATQCPGTLDLAKLIQLAQSINQGGSPVASSSIVDETTIRLVYNGFLMRDASPDEVNVWAGKTEEAFMREVLGSAEHQQILNYWQTKGDNSTVLKPGKYRVQ